MRPAPGLQGAAPVAPAGAIVTLVSKGSPLLIGGPSRDAHPSRSVCLNGWKTTTKVGCAGEDIRCVVFLGRHPAGYTLRPLMEGFIASTQAQSEPPGRLRGLPARQRRHACSGDPYPDIVLRTLILSRFTRR